MDNNTNTHPSSNLCAHENFFFFFFFKNSERQRLENIRRNQEAMQMFNLPEAASAISRSSDRSKRPAPTVGVKREKRTKTTEALPRRTSNRLANIAVRKRKD